MKKLNISTYRAERVIEKNGVFCLVLFTTKVMIIRMSKKWLIFHIFCRVQQKLSPSLGKIFKYILKVLFSPSTKYHGLWSSELPLARCQHLKIQDLILLCWLRIVLIFLLSMAHEQLSPKPIDNTIFCKNSKTSYRCT